AMCSWVRSAPRAQPREYLERLLSVLPHSVTLAKPGDLAEILSGLVQEMKQRGENEHAADAPPAFLFIHGMQRFNKLRYEADFGFSGSDAEAPANPSALL